jgi:hypothetical protein
MLPVHHHLYDTKLLMLAVPACAMLWAEGGRTGRLALLVTGAGFALTGDISWTMIFWFVNHLHLPAAGARGWILTALHVFPAPLILLVMSVLYLWAYARNARAGNDGEGAREVIGGGRMAACAGIDRKPKRGTRLFCWIVLQFRSRFTMIQ